MGIEALQTYLENDCKSAVVGVDIGDIIQKLAEEVPPGTEGSGRTTAATGRSKISLIIDAECCLDRLYGGLHADWFSGGQWNRMYEFLTAVHTACVKTGVKLLVFTNGALEKPRIRQWAAKQVETKRKLESTIRHVSTRGSPPAGALWTPPAGLRQVLRLALRHIGISVACSLDDHKQELISYCRQNNFDGVLVRDAEYAIFAAAKSPPRLFSASAFKLSFRKQISTSEFLLDNLAKALNLHPDRFPLLGALLGNHILTSDDLKAFQRALINGGDPKVAKPKILVEKVADFVRRLPQADDWQAIAKVAFNDVTDVKRLAVLVKRLQEAVQYFVKGTAKGYAQPDDVAGAAAPAAATAPVAAAASEGFAPSGLEDLPPLEDSNLAFASDTDKEKECLEGKLGELKLEEEVCDSKKVLQLIVSRHQPGFMVPWVHHVIKHREVKLDVSMEDPSSDDIPPPLDVYREARQKIYGILLDARDRSVALQVIGDEPSLVVKEWYVARGNSGDRADYVPAKALDWDVPNVERLWFGVEQKDKITRMKAFLSIMGVDFEEIESSCPLLDVNKVPRKYLMLCSTLRYLLRYSSEKKGFLSRVELDAVLATAVSPIIKNVSLTKEMKLPKVHSKALTVAALLMQGIEIASFANDACGSPVPWQFTCPWEFFDGKIFHLKMVMSSSNRPLLDVCDGNKALLIQVERMRDAILAAPGLALSRPKILVASDDKHNTGYGESHYGFDNNNNDSIDSGYGGGFNRFQGMSGSLPSCPTQSYYNGGQMGGRMGGPGIGRGQRITAAVANSQRHLGAAVNNLQQQQLQQHRPAAVGRVGNVPQRSKQEAMQQEANAYANYHLGTGRFNRPQTLY